MAEKQIIEVMLEKHENMDAAGITIPFDVEKVFGAKRVPVKIEVNGADYRSTIVRMGGRYMLGFPKEFRKRAGVAPGDHIVVTLEKDDAPRTIEMPADLADAINKAGLSDAWQKLSYTYKKEHVRAIEEAKQEATRLKRIEKAVAMARGKER